MLQLNEECVAASIRPARLWHQKGEKEEKVEL